MKRYDAIIIGFGKGGKLLAVELANRNWNLYKCRMYSY